MMASLPIIVWSSVDRDLAEMHPQLMKNWSSVRLKWVFDRSSINLQPKANGSSVGHQPGRDLAVMAPQSIPNKLSTLLELPFTQPSIDLQLDLHGSSIYHRPNFDVSHVTQRALQ